MDDNESILNNITLSPAEKQVIIEQLHEIQIAVNRALVSIESNESAVEFGKQMSGIMVPFESVSNMFASKIMRHQINRLLG